VFPLENVVRSARVLKIALVEFVLAIARRTDVVEQDAENLARITMSAVLLAPARCADLEAVLMMVSVVLTVLLPLIAMVVPVLVTALILPVP